MAPHVDLQRLDPIGERRREVGRDVLAVADREEPFAEQPLVEARASVRDDRLQRQRDAGATHEIAGPEATLAGEVFGALDPAQLAGHAREQRRCRKAARRVDDGRLEHRRQREPAEALVEREPAVDAAGHGRGAQIVGERHDVVALEAKLDGIGAATRPARTR